MNSPRQTILTPEIYKQYVTEYQLSFSQNSLLSGTVGNKLQAIIRSVELDLNTFTHNRLYHNYPPENVQPTGVNGLSAQTEMDTLYNALTKAVVYKLQTGSYVNFNASYQGNMNSSNSFSASNSNMVGLRNDIRDAFVMLGLYHASNIGNVYPTSNLEQIKASVLSPQLASSILLWLEQQNITFYKNIAFADDVQIGNQTLAEYITANTPSFVELTDALSNYYNTVTNSYTPIPQIGNLEIQSWNNMVQQFNDLLVSYVNNKLPIPYITAQDIARWNSLPIQGNLDPILTDVSTIKNNIQGISTSVQTNTNNIATNTSNISQLQTQVQGNAENIAQGQQALSKAVNLIGEVQKQTNTNTTNIANLQSANTTIQNSITQNTNNITNLQGEFTTIADAYTLIGFVPTCFNYINDTPYLFGQTSYTPPTITNTSIISLTLNGVYYTQYRYYVYATFRQPSYGDEYNFSNLSYIFETVSSDTLHCSPQGLVNGWFTDNKTLILPIPSGITHFQFLGGMCYVQTTDANSTTFSGQAFNQGWQSGSIPPNSVTSAWNNNNGQLSLNTWGLNNYYLNIGLKPDTTITILYTFDFWMW